MESAHMGDQNGVNLTQLIVDRYPHLSKGHKKVANFVLEHGDRAAFMTLEQLAQETGVSRGTAERFARELGFVGYPQFKEKMASLLRESLVPVEKVRVGMQKQITPDLALRSAFTEDIHNLERTLQAISTEQFARAAALMRQADRIVLLGLGSSSYVAGLGVYRLSTFRSNVFAITESGGILYRQLYWLGERDVLLAISFPRYSRATVEACRYAHTKQLPVLALTDKLTSPLYGFATETLLVRSERELLAASLTAALTMIDALALTIAGTDQRRTLEAISEVTNLLIEADEFYPSADQDTV
jgi:DNA-binding MurR/RpiR family transcriptional regulator